MEMEGVQHSGMAHPHPHPAPPVLAPEQQHQHRQDERPSPEIKLQPLSPATATGTGTPLNGAAPPSVQQSEQPSPPAVASPGARSGTPHSASRPSTPRLPLPLAHIAGASLQAAANAAVNAAAQHHNAAPRTRTPVPGQDHLRWRDPITVQYDAGGHPLAGKLSNGQPSPQQSSVHLPPVVTPIHQQQQQQQQQIGQQQTGQFGPPGGYHLPRASQPQAIAPLPALQQQQHQHPQQHQQHQQQPHQNPPNSHPNAQPSLHNHILNVNHNHQHPAPPPPPHQFHHHQPPPTTTTSYSSKPVLLPSLPSLPPISLHQPPSLAAHVAPSPVFHTSGSHATPAQQVVSKPLIMDPPRRATQPAGFPSPLQDYARTNPKFLDDCTRLTFAVQQSLPEAVRRIVRDNWQKCLLGSEFHQAFVLNASIHHATPSITQRAVKDFGGKMVAESAEELVKHFTVLDLDNVADLVLEKASDSFLDKCMAKRLLTIGAKPLVNALARAERLGYDQSDSIILEDRHERVVVQEAFPGAPAASAQVAAQPRSNPTPQGRTPPLQCGLCFRTFPYQAPFDYHILNKVCSIPPPTNRGFAHLCTPCGQGFDRIEELAAHTDSKVCSAQARPVAQTPVANGFVPSQARPTPTQIRPTPSQPTPTQPQSLPRRAATSTAGTPSGSPIPSDPYAHLTQDKLDAMNEELKEAEAKYAPRFQEAELIADEKERRARVEGLRNSFGTKQSMIRKKYGVRLRERRTKAEIAAERERLGIKRMGEMERSATSTYAVDPAPRPKQPAAPRPSVGSAWTAANTPRADSIWQEHDAKRRRLDNAGETRTSTNGVDQTTPSRKLLSATELGGGLAGSSATAELHDPTMPPQPTKVYEQSGARVQIHEPATNGHLKQEAISVDDSSDSSDDEDIPSTLPSRSTPQRKSHLGTATAS